MVHFLFLPFIVHNELHRQLVIIFHKLSTSVTRPTVLYAPPPPLRAAAIINIILNIIVKPFYLLHVCMCMYVSRVCRIYSFSPPLGLGDNDQDCCDKTFNETRQKRYIIHYTVSVSVCLYRHSVNSPASFFSSLRSPCACMHVCIIIFYSFFLLFFSLPYFSFFFSLCKILFRAQVDLTLASAASCGGTGR